MRVSPSVWDSPSWERLLCDCCVWHWNPHSCEELLCDYCVWIKSHKLLWPGSPKQIFYHPRILTFCIFLNTLLLFDTLGKSPFLAQDSLLFEVIGTLSFLKIYHRKFQSTSICLFVRGDSKPVNSRPFICVKDVLDQI